MEILKDEASEKYTVRLENSDGTFTITATTPSGNEIVISKSDDSFVMTVTKDFAEALGLEVYCMGPDAAPLYEPKVTLTRTPDGMMSVDGTGELSVSLDSGKIDNVVWSVEEGDAVEVVPDASDKGKATVTAVKPGTATVKATVTAIKNGQTKDVSETMEITVKNEPTPSPSPTPFEPIATITSAPTEPMSVGDEATVEVSVDKGTVGNVVWTSDTDIVKVEKSTDTTAVITAVKPGTATVKAVVTAVDGDNTFECEETTAEITVKYEPKALINGAYTKMDLSTTKDLTVSVDIGDIEPDTIEWSVKGDAVTKTDNAADKSKVTINAVKAGKATVTVKFTAKYDDEHIDENVTSSVEIEVFETAEDAVLSTVDEGRYDDKTGEIVIDDETSDNASTTILDLPQSIKANETVEITITGTYTGDKGFRLWIGNGPNSYVQTPEVFDADFANGAFSRTFELTNINKEEATKITFKGVNNANINGLRVNSLSVDYFERTPDMEVDLRDPNSYRLDVFGNPIADYSKKDQCLDVNFNGMSVFVIKNPAQKSVDRYKYVTIEYSTDKDNVPAYWLKSENPDDHQEIDALSKTGDTSNVVTIRAYQAIYGFKLFSFDGGEISIKSIVFSNKHPDPGYVDMSSVKVLDSSGDISYNEVKDIVTIKNATSNGRALFKLPENVKNGDTIKVKINGTFTGVIEGGIRLMTGTDAGGGWGQSDQVAIDSNDKLNDEHEIHVTGDSQYLIFAHNYTGVPDLEIKGISVTVINQ